MTSTGDKEIGRLTRANRDTADEREAQGVQECAAGS